MQLRSKALTALFAACLFTTGCGDDGGDDDGYTLADVCDVSTGLYIEFFNNALECQGDLLALLGTVPSPAELAVACEAQFSDFVANGTVIISQDQAAWDTCLSFISSIDCNTFAFDGPNPCEGIFEGQLGEGEECDDSTQCAGDAYCDDSDGLACGVCTLRADNGTTCGSDDECSGRLCAADNTCQEYGDLGDPCLASFECAGTLVCDEGGSCALPPVWALGDPCDGMNISTQCGFPFSELYCHPATDECTAYLEVGEVCGQGVGFCRLVDYETCENGGVNVDDQCIAPTIVNEGDECGFQLGLKCAGGLVCANDGDTGTCVVPSVAGDACFNDECPGNLLLSCVEGVCDYNDHTGMCPAPAP